MDAAQRSHVERWLSRRGLPQLIEGYGSERSIDVRTIRWVLLWAAAQIVVLCWSAPVSEELRIASAAAGLGLLGLYVLAYGKLTKTNLWRPMDSLAWYDVVLTGTVPAIIAGARFGDVTSVIQGFLFHLQGVLIIYAVIGFGVVWILLWSVGWMTSQVAHLLALAARTLPLILILVIFLLFSSELWEAAVVADAFEILAVVGVAVLIAVGFLGTRVAEDVRALEATRPDADQLVGTPAEPAQHAITLPERQPPLRGLQRLNVALVLLISQALQAAFVAATIVLFLIVVGLLLAPAAIQDRWAGGAVVPVLTFNSMGELRVLSQELIKVAVLLGAFAGTYFAGFALDDERYRAGAVAGTLADIRRALAVRAAYVTAQPSAAQD